MLPVRIGGERGIGAWAPFRELRKVHEEMDRLFATLWPRTDHDLAEAVTWAPAVDMYEDEDHIIVKAELPGVKKEDVSLSLTEDLLTIKGERKYEKEEKKENFFRFEGCYGSFLRTLELPRPVKFEEARAEYKDGILKIMLPKAERSRTHEIRIDVK
jgi:HSP20 family protein